MTNIDNLKEKFYNIIMDLVVNDEQSPYNQMLRKTLDIDIDYFNNISRDCETIPDELNFELKEKVVNDFSVMADTLYNDNLTHAILNEIYKSENNNFTPDMHSPLLESIRTAITLVEKWVNAYSDTYIDQQRLQRLFEEAKRRTLIERLLNNNKADIIAFHHALMDNTVWACKRLIKERTLSYLNNLQEHISNLDIQTTATIDNDTTYTPHPIDTSDIHLSDELMQLVEQMAENTHEVWAATRISQGWSYGTERDDARKLHPCLIAYNQLPEDEKTYDRNTSIEVLKLILKLGFKISR